MEAEKKGIPAHPSLHSLGNFWVAREGGGEAAEKPGKQTTSCGKQNYHERREK